MTRRNTAGNKRLLTTMNKSALIYLMVVLGLTSCFQIFDVGNNTLIKETYNNNAGKKAILFFKGGNATSDISLQVIVAGYEYELKKRSG